MDSKRIFNKLLSPELMTEAGGPSDWSRKIPSLKSTPNPKTYKEFMKDLLNYVYSNYTDIPENEFYWNVGVDLAVQTLQNMVDIPDFKPWSEFVSKNNKVKGDHQTIINSIMHDLPVMKKMFSGKMPVFKEK